MAKDHIHQWAYSHKSCCFTLRCLVPGCERWTRAYHVKGNLPAPGTPVKLLEDQETFEAIGSPVEG